MKCIPLLLAMLLAVPAWAADSVSAAVQTVALQQQMLTDTVSGYGVVSSDARNVQSVSLPRAGQVQAVYVNAGQRVTKGTTLIAFGTGTDAALTYQQAVTALHFAQAERTRVAQLLGQQLATQSQLGAADKAVADALAALNAQQKIGAGKALEQVVAPFDGLIAVVSVLPGDRLAAGMAVVQLAKSGSQRVILGIEPEDVTKVRTGMQVEVVSVFNNSRSVKGRVTQVFGMINPQTQLVDVLVELSDSSLMTGTRVRASIQLGQQAAWVVPRSAILRDTQGAYLFQVQQGHAQRINVQTGLEQDGRVAVTGDFVKGAPVVSLGNYELQDGMAVRGGKQ
ncbi:MAG: efflux RND transporter periplasmic adaptor subunit [Sulfuriferula sp.]|nr:efflux RND transporter periplasmic adaptor subunit [Sulfuriferula sp.]